MPTSGTVARVRTVFTGVTGAPAYSNLWFDADSSTAGAYQTAVLNMWTALAARIKSPVLATMVNPIPIINVGTGEVVDVAIGAGGTTTATQASESLPFTTCGLAQIHTGVFVGSREIRGRCFVPYPTEGDNVAGLPAAAYRTAVESAFAAMNGISGANGAHAIYSKAHARFELVSGVSCWSQWASLRSRRD